MLSPPDARPSEGGVLLGAGHTSRTNERDGRRQGIAALRRRMDEANHSADERVRASASEAVQQSAQAHAAAQGKSRFLAAGGYRLRQPLNAMHLFRGPRPGHATPLPPPAIDRLSASAHAEFAMLPRLTET